MTGGVLNCAESLNREEETFAKIGFSKHAGSFGGHRSRRCRSVARNRITFLVRRGSRRKFLQLREFGIRVLDGNTGASSLGCPCHDSGRGNRDPFDQGPSWDGIGVGTSVSLVSRSCYTCNCGVLCRNSRSSLVYCKSIWSSHNSFIPRPVFPSLRFSG